MFKLRLKIALAAIALSLAAFSAAATVVVNVVNFDFTNGGGAHFNPIINVGDAVEWHFLTSGHTTTSASGQAEAWNSGFKAIGATYTHTFTNEGTFNYYCVAHGFDGGNGTVGGMSGSIVVVHNPALATFTIAPSAVTGGTSAHATVTLDSVAPVGGTDVTLASSDASVSAPATVHVAEGATTAQTDLTTTPVPVPTNVTVTAGLDGRFLTAHVVVRAPILTSVTFNPKIIAGSQSTTASVHLSGPAPAGGFLVTLSDNSAFSSVPDSVMIPEGAILAPFTVTTTAVTSAVSAKIMATRGTRTVGGILTILPTVLSSLTLDPTSGHGGMTVTGTVTLALPAPTGGATVLLSSANPSKAPVPASVLVPAGQLSKTFTINTGTVTQTTNIQIVASRAGVVKPRVLTLVP